MRSLAAILVFAAFVSTALSQGVKPTASAKPKPAAARSSEAVEWEKAAAITDATQRIEALRKFVARFPRSTHLSEAHALIATDEAVLGNDKLAADDQPAATKLMRAAVKDAPKPLPDQLFTDTLSKIPAKLYFRGLRDEGVEIARALEAKAETNIGQLLTIANFYLSVENGSEAKRVAENAIKADANSSAAYQTLGLANRVDFKLEESAAAYAKALELEPDSATARRGLAEMKRSLGLADNAVTLYREILSKDEANLPAKTGLIMALFESGKRGDAEAELAKTLEATPSNIILLASAAYWYAANGEGDKAIAFAQRAIDEEPHFIWSHIALARGWLALNKPLDAEKALLAARRYGNFPTLEYEIASARLAAGLYRDAAEELSKSFSVKDGMVHTKLGGRVSSDAKNFTDLVGFERKASLFAPIAADTVENATQLKNLLAFKQALTQADVKTEIVAGAADEFVRGDDKMKVHRQIFAGSELLEKKTALSKAIEIAQAAPASLDSGLDVSEPAAAVLASELYESRTIAIARGEYVNLPAVPRATLSAVLRGRIEEITGWAYYQMDDAAKAVIHLKRATGVLPVDSAWWRASMWQLGTALSVSGNDGEALEAYIKSYRSSGPDAMRYNAISTLYKRVKGSSAGLEKRIGSDPSVPPPEVVAQKAEPTPEIRYSMPAAVPVEAQPSSTPESVPIKVEPSPAPSEVAQTFPSPQNTDAATAIPTASVESIAFTPTPIAVETIAATPSPFATVELTFEPTRGETPKQSESPTELPSALPTALIEQATPEEKPTPEDINPAVVAVVSEKPTPEPMPEVRRTSESSKENTPKAKATPTPKDLFPPVIITIPAPVTPSTTPDAKTADPKPTATPDVDQKKNTTAIGSPSPEPTVEIKPCILKVSPDDVTLKNTDGVLAVVVSGNDDLDLADLKGVSTSPENVSVRREVIEGLKTNALFVVRSTSARTGVYQIEFEMPCGKKEITVKVQ